jgi:hypothetical protein
VSPIRQYEREEVIPMNVKTDVKAGGVLVGD